MVRVLVIGSAAAGIAALAGGPLIAALQRLGIAKAISAEGPEAHQPKAGTATMGGLLMLTTILALTLATNVAGHPSLLLPLGVMGAVGVVGALDDMQTLQGRAKHGGHERLGFVAKEAVFLPVGAIAGAVVYYALDRGGVAVPHFGGYELNPALYIILAAGVTAATTSAAAVTDGLDGLLGGLMALAFAGYGVISLIEGERALGVFCFTVTGAALGFLWHNAHPARLFMGETGALPLGAGLATVALMSGWWLLLLIIGLVLLLEGLSVVVQVASYRTTGRRVFRMAPLHHHFELAGWAETQVVFRFWLLGGVGAMLGVALALTE